MENKSSGETPKPGYETRGVSTKFIIISGAVLFLVMVLVLVAMRGMFDYLRRPPGPPASVLSNARELPPGPQLQVDPRKQLRDYLANQKATLDSYGWVDRNEGIVRIPIERAMELLLKKGLPVRSGSVSEEALSEPQKRSLKTK